MNEELKKSFAKLDINNKRNQISRELYLMNELILVFEKNYNVKPLSKVKNYDISKDQYLSESDMLTFIYEDIYNIEQELITLLKVFEKNKK